MRGYPKLIASLAGVFLFAIMLPATGRIAALPWPAWVADVRRHYPQSGFIVLDMVFYAVPSRQSASRFPDFLLAPSC
jgi:hypothetical protein